MDNIKNGTLVIKVDSLSDIEKIDKVMLQCGVWCGIYYPYSKFCLEETGNPFADINPKEIPTIKAKS